MKTFFNDHDSEDSTWKIVYMDMITMLMILFLSLWIIDRGKTNDKRKHGDITLNKVQFEADDYFDPGKAEIKETAKEQMEDLFFNQRNAFPKPGVDAENGGRRVVIIQGHTDDQGEKDKNFELGFQRAMAVYTELSKKMPTLPAHVGICSFADNFPVEKVRPVVKGAPKEWINTLAKENRLRRKKNRRFELIGQFEEFQELGDALWGQ